MKFCMILAGDKDFSTNACRASDRLGYTPLDAEEGFHTFNAGDHDSVNIAVIDMETMRPARIINKLHAIGRDHKLMPFCMSPEDSARLKCLMGSELPCIIPFNQLN
jgi:hypothetical protein